MTPGKKATAGQSVSPAEINDLIMRARDLRTHLESNQRHLNMIEARLMRVEAELDPLKAALVVDVDEEAEG